MSKADNKFLAESIAGLLRLFTKTTLSSVIRIETKDLLEHTTSYRLKLMVIGRLDVCY